MPDTYTPKLTLTKVGISESRNTWGQKLNANADKIDAGVLANSDAIDALEADLEDLTAVAATKFPSSGGTITGALVMASAVSALAAVTVTGPLTIPAPSSAMHAATKQYVDTATAWSPLMDLFIGCSFEYSGVSLPAGFLWEDGSAVSRTTYAKLFARLGGTYGGGDGSTTFNLPDSRGRVAVTRDNQGFTGFAQRVSGVLPSTTLGGTGGDQWLQNHGHGVGDPGHSHPASTDVQGHHDHALPMSVASYGLAGGNGGLLQHTGLNGGIRTEAGGGHGHNVSVGASGTGIWIGNAGAGGSQNIQPSIIKHKIIFAGVF